MANPFQIQFTLRQHTPMIHFQHDQDGATLRATEVKPKLDRFIVEKAFGNDFEKVKTYLVGYDENNEKALKKRFDTEGYRALDYKVLVKIDRHEILQDIKNPLYFGNMGNETQPKYHTTSSNEKVEAEIFCVLDFVTII